MEHTAMVVVRVMCTFDVEVDVSGQDVALAESAAEARGSAIIAVSAARFADNVKLAKGISPTARALRVHASLEIA